MKPDILLTQYQIRVLRFLATAENAMLNDLEAPHKNSGRFLELTELGELGLVRRNGLRFDNFTYSISEKGKAYLEQLEAELTADKEDKDFREKSFHLSEQANKFAKRANTISIIATLIAFLSLVVAVIAIVSPH